jgi:colanic acid biosynthesis glycosyl transferase WcaI
MSRFDLVSAVSAKMLEAIAAKGVPASRRALFPNWVNCSEIFPLPNPAPMRRKLGMPEGRCIVLYSGSMGRKQGLEHVIEAARRLVARPESPLFVLAGAGPERDALESASRDLSNLIFLPLQPEEQFNEFLNIGDIHLLPQLLDANDLVMPSKLGAMLAVGKPIIATVPPDSQIALTIGEAGIVVPPEDPTALAAAIEKLAAEPAERARLGRSARTIAVQLFDAARILTSVEDRLRRLSG